MDHETSQFLTGHGAFKDYLYKHGKSETPLCDNCGEEDTPAHVILHCPVLEDDRLPLRVCHREVGIAWPGTLPELIQNEFLFREVRRTWTRARERRDV